MNSRVMVAGLAVICMFAVVLMVPMSGDSEGAVAYTDDVTGLKYTLNDDGTAAVGVNTSITGEVIIPTTLEVEGKTYTITSVVAKAFQKAKITSIEFPDTIKTMGSNALDQTTQLTSVKLPANLESIPSNFLVKSAITSISIPNSVTSIGNYAFKECTSLKSIDLSGLTKLTSIGSYAFQKTTALETAVMPDSAVTFGTKVFDGNTSMVNPVYGNTEDGKTLVYAGVGTTGQDLSIVEGTVVLLSYSISACVAETVSVPASVTTISTNTFNGNANVKNVVLADGSKLEELGGSAFANCKSLQSFNLEKATGLLTIGPTVFTNCSSLTSLQIAGTPEITAGTFRNSGIENAIYSGTALCYAGKSPDFTIKDGTVTIMGYAFTSFEGTEVEIPTSVTTLEKQAFATVPKLETISIPGTVTDMTGGYTFQDSTALKAIILAEGITSLPDYFADGCKALAEVNFPSTLKTVGKYAFMDAALTELVIPAGVEEFKDYSFRNNKLLTSVEIHGTPVFGPSMFLDCTGLESFEFPEGTEPAQKMFDGCTSLASVKLPSGITSIPASLFLDCSKLSSVNIPATVTTIDGSAFSGCEALEQIDIPTKVVKISSYAFRNTGLTSIVLPESVTDLSAGNTFYGCTKLTSVTIKAPYADAGSYLFRNCSALTTVEIYGMIDGNANTFRYCTALEDIIVHSATPFVSADMSQYLTVSTDECGCKFLNVTKDGEKSRMILSLGDNCTTLGADYCSASLDIIESGKITSFEGNKYFSLENGFLTFDKDYLVYVYPAAGSVIEIPEGVVEIGPYALSASTDETPYSYVFLSSTTATLHSRAISSPADIIIAPGFFKAHQDCIHDDARLYLGDTSKDVDTDVTGFFVLTDKARFLVDYVEGATITAGGFNEYLGINVDLQQGYDRSLIHAVANGAVFDRLDSPVTIGDVAYNGFLVGPSTGNVHIHIDDVELNSYNVSLICPEGTSVYGNTEELIHGTVASFNIAPETGYRFSDSFAVLLDGKAIETVAKDGFHTVSFTITDDVELEIQGIVPADTITITYNVNGGTAMDAVDALPGQEFTPEVPVKNGYAFLGWYLDAEFTEPFYSGMKIDKDTALNAKWTDSDKTYKIEFDVSEGQGEITAIANGHMILKNGDRVPAGSDVVFIFTCENPYEPVIWNVSGVSEKSHALYRSFSIDSDTSVLITSEYMYTGTYVNTVYMETATLENYKPLWILKSQGSNFSGMYYTPGVIGDYLYSKCQNNLVKINSFTGEVVASVQTSPTYSGYYQYVCVGNNLILDGYSGKVYNTDLEQVFALSEANRKAFYHDGMFFVTDSEEITYAYSAIDSDPTVPDEVHEPVWAKDIGSRVTTYEGGSTILFQNGYAAVLDFIDIDGVSYPQLNTFDYKAGEKIDSYTMLEMPGVSGEKGYIDISEGYLTVTTYGTGLFEGDTGKPLNNVGIIEIDAFGNLNDASYRSFYTGAGQSYHTAFIVEQGLGFVAGDEYFMVYDMETLELVAKEKLPLASGHGSMTTSVSDGKLRAYIVPYQSSTDLPAAEYDFTTGKLRTFLLEDVALAQWGSQQARFLQNGSIVYVNDGGNIYCVGGIDTFKYTVQHVSTDGEILGSSYGTANYGTVLEYGDLVSSFDGYTLVEKDRTFEVSASHQANVFTIYYESGPEITWVVDGVEYTESYDMGDIPTYDGTPVKESTESSDFTFIGWSPEIVEVTGDATYTAVFEETPREYTISFYKEDGTTLIQDVKVAYGNTVTAPEAPEKPAGTYPYEFDYWGNMDGTEADLTAPVIGDAEYKAVYRMVVPTEDLYDIEGDVTVTSDKTTITLTITLTDGAKSLDSAFLVVIASYDDGRHVNTYPTLDLSSETATIVVSTNGLTSVVVEIVDEIPEGEYVHYGGYVYAVTTE